MLLNLLYYSFQGKEEIKVRKKYIYILLFLVLMAIVSYRYFPDSMPEKKQVEEGAEENINAYELEDDRRLTRDLKREDNEILALSRQETEQLLEKISPKKENTILNQYNSKLPETINETLRYFQYPISYNYFLVTVEKGTKIREGPQPGDNVVGRVENLDKVSLLQRVEGKEKAGSRIWYRIAAEREGQIDEGYLHSSEGIPRTFRFQAMKEKVDELRGQLNEGKLNFISNYRNQNGTPPQEGNIKVDEYGYRVYHSAPAYERASTDANYRYVPDGMLVRILDQVDGFYHVNIPSFGGDFYVPENYINPETGLENLNQVLVVDDEQQNQALFEVTEAGFNMVSYTLATTGAEGDYSFRTSPGNYKALGKKERFEYLKKGSDNVAGYAPFATRFSGGAYVHGVPVSYEEQNGEKVDPGLEEYLHTIGTFPRSSMCVRNFTSHAKFVYNWMDAENGAVIVME